MTKDEIKELRWAADELLVLAHAEVARCIPIAKYKPQRIDAATGRVKRALELLKWIERLRHDDA